MNHFLTGALPRRRVIEWIELRGAEQAWAIEKTTASPRGVVVDWVIPASAFYEGTGAGWPHGTARTCIGVKGIPCAAVDIWTDGRQGGAMSSLAPDEIWWDGEVGGEEDAGAEFAGAFLCCVVVFYVIEEIASLSRALGWKGFFAAAGIENLVPNWD